MAASGERGIIMAKCTGVLCRMPDGYKVDECDCKDCPCRTEPITNADRIRSMTDDELNELFHEIYNAGAEDAVSSVWGNRTNNFEWTMEWLQQTAGEEDKHEPTG